MVCGQNWSPRSAFLRRPEPAFSLTDIGELLGVAEASVFTRCFRRWSGVTPSQWRSRQFG
ncbi:AraC family transcriptional regulator [Seongchinamella sediminis]|uniref:AraC family transcriptional regulator n=2 Tax=Seongchinamella sediminis TaxID=2283635 RepID=A0A3L7DRX5_9GAMM|nr:AraC family transcriptional regulator [Seongchinamella sediminis]